MGHIQTPIVTPLRTQGGTFYSFNSVIEDIGLNVIERQNKIALSHYVLLNIPDCDELSDNPNVNKFNIFSMPGVSSDVRINSEYNTILKNQTVNEQIAQSFMSYALNMEAIIVNNKKYDYTTSLSVSERVFWKWLKETGAIRWHKDSSNFLHEENENEYYKRVVQAIGKIDGVTNRSSDYGMYNEIYVNIPSSFGNQELIFNEISDNNYSYDKIFTSDNYKLVGREKQNDIILNSNMLNIGFYDYTPAIENNNITNIIDDNTYIYNIDKKVDSPGTENTRIDISINDNIRYSFNRSNYDCLTLDINLESSFYKQDDTYDSLARDVSSNNYYFNAILIYYSIYDKNNNILATNLYGVYFIDSPEDLIRVSNSDENDVNTRPDTIKFRLPSLHKIKSSDKGFGTSYAFKLNMRTSSIYDSDNIEIYDNSSSENSIISDFNNVVASLNKTINLLNNHTKNTYFLVNKINELEKTNQLLQNNIVKQDNIIKNILNQKQLTEYENIKTNSLDINNYKMIDNNTKLRLQYENDEILSINDNIIELNKNLKHSNLIYKNNSISNNTNTNTENTLLQPLLQSAADTIIENINVLYEEEDKLSLLLNNDKEKEIDLISLISAMLEKIKEIENKINNS